MLEKTITQIVCVLKANGVGDDDCMCVTESVK